jgi:hypothetical protein
MWEASPDHRADGNNKSRLWHHPTEPLACPPFWQFVALLHPNTFELRPGLFSNAEEKIYQPMNPDD